MDRGAWRAVVHGIAESQIALSTGTFVLRGTVLRPLLASVLL